MKQKAPPKKEYEATSAFPEEEKLSKKLPRKGNMKQKASPRRKYEAKSVSPQAEI